MHPLVAHLRIALQERAHEQSACEQQRYMRDQFSFMGVTMPVRRTIFRDAFKRHLITSTQELHELVCALWHMPERDFHYAACDLLRANKRWWSSETLDIVRYLIATKSWWDTVDTLAANVVGPLVMLFPNQKLVMHEWIEDECLWIRRTAIIYQLRYKEKTDKQQLFHFALSRAHEKDFFMRKAIGWALREYAKTSASCVYEFVIAHASILSPLSCREATKHLKKK